MYNENLAFDASSDNMRKLKYACVFLKSDYAVLELHVCNLSVTFSLVELTVSWEKMNLSLTIIRYIICSGNLMATFPKFNDRKLAASLYFSAKNSCQNVLGNLNGKYLLQRRKNNCKKNGEVYQTEVIHFKLFIKRFYKKCNNTLYFLEVCEFCIQCNYRGRIKKWRERFRIPVGILYSYCSNNL